MADEKLSSEMDEGGRVTVPTAVLYRMGLVPGDAVEFVLSGDDVIFQRPSPPVELSAAK